MLTKKIVIIFIMALFMLGCYDNDILDYFDFSSVVNEYPDLFEYRKVSGIEFFLCGSEYVFHQKLNLYHPGLDSDDVPAHTKGLIFYDKDTGHKSIWLLAKRTEKGIVVNPSTLAHEILHLLHFEEKIFVDPHDYLSVKTKEVN